MTWAFWRLVGPLVRWWTENHPKWSGYPCPWCGFADYDAFVLPWYEHVKYWEYNTAGDGRIRCWEGVQTCPRCFCRWGIADSS